jgi:membrane peptidoglycan carboxypeptidase
MPRQDCGAAARSIPKGLIPNLPTLSLKGQIDFKASLNLDLNAPGDLTLEVTGKDQDCKVLSLSPNIDPTLLRGPFVHHPREPKRGVLEHIAVGRGTPEWVPSERIPDIVKLAAWVTEDRAWLDHRGVRFELVARALKIDLQHGRFIYGGSTITQQLVKNLYLTRDKNLARKLEEAIIAWQMERVLTKDEILTTYINCIEYGPDIYGIKQAAKTYFGKRVDDLDALESAFIMGLKPYPRAGYNQFLKGQLDVWWVRRVSHVTRLLAKFGPQYITPEEAEVFGQEPINWQPTFRRP